MSQLSDTAITDRRGISPLKVLTDDKTKFPLIEIPDIGTLTLWPITKIQFEKFIAQSNQYGDVWYDEILKCNPRVSYKSVDKKNYEQLFITGLYPKETVPFSKWFGEGYRIPTVKEWRDVYQLLSSSSNTLAEPAGVSEQAKKIWEKIRSFSEIPEPLPLYKFLLMEGGVIEWVRKDNENYVGIGRPRNDLHPTCHNPLTDLFERPRKSIPDKRLEYHGFRLIRK